MISDFKKLEIWRRNRILIKEVYLCTKDYPNEERFGLISQRRRASVSVPSNIAEGSGRQHIREFKQFLHIAIASLCELETRLYLSFDLEIIRQPEANKLISEVTEIRKMILGFSKSVKA